MTKLIEIGAKIKDGVITAQMEPKEIVRRVMEDGQIVILKSVFSDEVAQGVRAAAHAWGQSSPPLEVDDFGGNYHRRRAMVSRLQQAPHVFHDYNFNDLHALEGELGVRAMALFEPLRRLYNALTQNNARFGVPPAGAYPHPQLIQYPGGGGFFGRHWHGLTPQKLGFIVALSKHGRDYQQGGAVFEVGGEVVDTEGRHDVGDICVWRYDHPHWVSQSDLKDKFDWASAGGRWVATFAYFDPVA